MNQIKNLFITNKDHLQFILLLFGGIILFFYSTILTFAPVIRTLSWDVPLKWEQWIAFSIWVFFGFLIHKMSSKLLPNRDPYLFPIIFVLTGLGILTIFRLSISFGWRQLIWFSLSSTIILLGIKFPLLLMIIRRYKYIWLFLGLLVTGLTFFFGIYPGGDGPRLWLGCCGLYFQPSEPLKLLFIVYLSAFFADNWAVKKNLSVLFIPTLIMVSAAIMILFSQRDLGTASIFLTIYAFYYFVVSGKSRTIILFLLLLIVAGIFGYLNFDLIQIRINGWLNPWLDPSGGSYQIIQSLQAIAAGHILGLGPGLGSPGVVPVAISDFIFAAISEELGLIGGLFIICLYTFLAYRGFLISIRTRNQFQKLLAFGITIFIAIQAILIIGGNTRLLPLTGVTLPFISYGGSSLVTVFISALFLLLISQNQSSKSIEIYEIKPYFISYSGILIGFSLLAVLSSYWSVIRSDSLLARPDNLRMIINDRYVPRGDLLDRQNNPILITTGTRGSYSRWLEDPSLSVTVGYNHPFLGQSGLEASMDSYLRGLAGMPSSDIFWNEMIYARPPDGLDIRTTIDLQRQDQITQILSAHQGAAVIMNAKTGEILAMWSSPSFDSNQIEDEWSELLDHDDAPLLNRVTQGKYEIGNLSSLFYYGYASEYLIKIDETNFYEGGNCASPLTANQKSTIQLAIMNGCSDANEYLAQLFDQNINIELIQKFGWSEVYEFELPIQAVPTPTMDSDQSLNALQISPLQLARASAAFSNAGYIPYPRLALAVNTPKQGWIAFQSNEPLKVTEVSSANQTANYFSRSDFPAWEISSSNFSTDNPTHWYVSGTLPNWQASPLVLVLTLETGTSEDAKLLGREIMENVLTTNN